MVKRLFAALAASVMMIGCAVTGHAASMDDLIPNTTIPSERLLDRLVDGADILSDSEEAKLLAKLDEISERHGIDVAVVTVYSLGDRTPMEAADDYYDYNGFGTNSSRDGFVMLLSMEERDRWFSGCGKGIEIFTDYGQQYMWEQVTPKLSSGDYYEAFNTYADISDKFITEWEKGKPFDTNHKVKGKLSPIWILISLGGGALIALIYCMSTKSKLMTVSMQHGADDYIRQNSFKVTDSRDTFLYRNISREYIETERSSGGGTSTHISSSGSSHSGSGGKF